MAISASSIVERASKIVQDTTNVRWPVVELIQWLNDGQREIVLHRPDSNPRTAQVLLSAGTRQTLTKAASTVAGGVGATTEPAKLLDVICNVAGSGRGKSIRLIAREILDSQSPDWHSTANATDAVKHYMFDPRDPLAFYVFPQATALSKVEILFSAYPTEITGDGAAQNISLTDIYGNALLDFVLYRSYSKDSEYAGNTQRAQAHYAAFANSLGLELKGTVMMGPTTTGAMWNPNAPKMNQAARSGS